MGKIKKFFEIIWKPRTVLVDAKCFEDLVLVVKATRDYRQEALKEQIWYIGMGCEFAERVDEALKPFERS